MNYIDYSDVLNIDHTLNQFLQLIRFILKSDAGSIYLKEQDVLKFKIFQNDSISKEDLNNKNVDLSKIEFSILEDDSKFLTVHTFLTQEVIKIDDVYMNNTLFDIDGIKYFDKVFNYQTKSMITIPLMHPFENSTIGVLQIINKKIDNTFIEFDEDDVLLLKLISSFLSMLVIEMQQSEKNLKNTNTNIKNLVTQEKKKNFEENTLQCHDYNITQMNQIIKNISHQWRNPLGELSLNNMFLQMKLLSTNKNDEIKNILENNDNIIQALSKTINNFQTVFDESFIGARNFHLKKSY